MNHEKLPDPLTQHGIQMVLGCAYAGMKIHEAIDFVYAHCPTNDLQGAENIVSEALRKYPKISFLE